MLGLELVHLPMIAGGLSVLALVAMAGYGICCELRYQLSRTDPRAELRRQRRAAITARAAEEAQR